MFYERLNLDESDRRRKCVRKIIEFVRTHRHELAPGQTGNVLRCKCGVVMGFMHDPRKVKS